MTLVLYWVNVENILKIKKKACTIFVAYNNSLKKNQKFRKIV